MRNKMPAMNCIIVAKQMGTSKNLSPICSTFDSLL